MLESSTIGLLNHTAQLMMSKDVSYSIGNVLAYGQRFQLSENASMLVNTTFEEFVPQIDLSFA